MFQHLFIDLLLHGEGGDGGAGAAPGAAPGPEASAVQAPVAGEQKAQAKPKARKYGQAERLPFEYGKPKPQDAGGQDPADGQQSQQKIPFSEIEKLYHDEIGAKIKTAVDGRFKNQADNTAELSTARAQLDEQNGIIAQLAEAQYGIKPGADGKADLEAIKAQIGKSRAEDYAIENGVSEEFAEKILQTEDKLRDRDRQLAELQRAEAERQKDAAQFARFQEHRQQAEAFRQKMGWPEFDLVAEMEQNPTFAHLLNCGVGVENAYFSAHHDELMAAQAHAAATQAQRALASRIQAGQSHPAEGGLGRSPAASPQRITNPKEWSKAMRADVRRRVERGEEIYL